MESTGRGHVGIPTRPMSPRGVAILVLGATLLGQAMGEFLSLYESYLRATTALSNSTLGGLVTPIPLLGSTPLGLLEYLFWPVLPFIGLYVLGARIDLNRHLVPFSAAAFIGGLVGLRVGFWVGQLVFFHSLSDSVLVVWFAIDGFYGFVVAFSAVALKHIRITKSSG